MGTQYSNLNERIIAACAANTFWHRTKAGLMRWDTPNHPSLLEALELMTGGRPEAAHDFWALRMDSNSNEIFLHTHGIWNTTIYYPQDHNSGLFTDMGDYVIRRGLLVDLPAGTPHGVRRNISDTTRYSVVCLHAIPINDLQFRRGSLEVEMWRTCSNSESL